MKRLQISFFGFICWLGQPIAAQSLSIPPDRIEVSDQFTTHLVFPQPVLSADCGAAWLQVQTAGVAPNVLGVKSSRAGEIPTNLTVITADHRLYSFLVSYKEHPDSLTLVFSGRDTGRLNLIDVGTGRGEAQPTYVSIQTTAEWVALNRMTRLHKWDVSGKVGVRLKDLFVRDDVYYFQFIISNHSSLSYHTKLIRFVVKDTRKAKRTAVQEDVLTPIGQYGSVATIHSGETRTLVVAIPKFTLMNGKKLAVSWLEKEGGRNFFITLKNRHLLRSEPLAASGNHDIL